jgi:hypothetical protein
MQGLGAVRGRPNTQRAGNKSSPTFIPHIIAYNILFVKHLFYFLRIIRSTRNPSFNSSASRCNVHITEHALARRRSDDLFVLALNHFNGGFPASASFLLSASFLALVRAGATK